MSDATSEYPHATGTTLPPTWPDAARPREQWEWLLPLLVLMQLIALVGVYFSPINPDLIAYLLGWLLLCLAVLWFVFGRANRILKLPHLREVTYKPNGAPIFRRRGRLASYLLGGADGVLVIATLELAF